MKIKKINIYVLLPLVVAVSIIAGFVLGTNASRKSSAILPSEILNQLYPEDALSGSKLESVLRYISDRYVDSVDVDTLTEAMIPKVLEKLDPHSYYISAKDVERATEGIEGNFEGVGIMFNMLTDTLIVLEVIPGGPSSKAGLENGDRIIKVDGENIAGVKYDQNEVVKKLRGPGGSKVKVSVERRGVNGLFDVEITRGKIPINSIDAALMLRPGIGYIKLLRFSKTTHSEVARAIDSLKVLGMKHLIFDLKGNAGGLLGQAILISNEFLPRGSGIVYTKGRKSYLDKQYADGNGRFTDQDLYVLVDETSASSSEIVAGALQDNDRGVIVGRRTFGKGLVQEQIPLYDGSLLNLTIAHYYTPSGRSIQRPYVKGKETDYYNDIIERYKHNELTNKDSVKVNDSLKFYTRSGRLVYGGGGIVPDEFVPIDTLRFPKLVSRALMGIDLAKYITTYVSDNRKQINEINTVEKLDAYFATKGNDIYRGYINYLRKLGVKFSAADEQKYKAEILPFLKANIGQYSPAGGNAFYYSIYPQDNIVMKAIEMIEAKKK